MKFENKEQVVDALVKEWNRKRASFYNTPTNDTIEDQWTFDYTLAYYNKLKKEYFITCVGNLAHNSLKGILS
jgi:hypothetical protein